MLQAHKIVRSGCVHSQVSGEADDMEYDSESDTTSESETSTRSTDLYSLEEMNQFLDETYKTSVKVSDYFSDTDKFIRSVDVLKRLVGFDLLDEKKRFHLKKHLTALRKATKGKTVRRRTRKSNAIMNNMLGFSIYCSLIAFSCVFPLSNFLIRRLKIGSLNISGGRDRHKRALIAKGSTLKNTDVLFLQETHSNPADETDWRLWW